MMAKRLLIFVFLVIIVYEAGAQKLSGWAVDVNSFIYTDTYGSKGDTWPSLFREGYYPLPYGTNLEFASRAKGGSFPSFRDGWGIRADLVKGLFPVSGTSSNRVDVSLGIGYRRYIDKMEAYPANKWDTWDTTTVRSLNYLKQVYSQQYVDIQTRAVYKLMDSDDMNGFYIGFAMQLSLAVGGRIQEDFTANESRWHTASQSWVETSKADMHQNVPAKRISYFSWGVPIGFMVKLSKNLMLTPEIIYWHHTNRNKVYPDNYGARKKYYSEGGYLSIGVRYKL